MLKVDLEAQGRGCTFPSCHAQWKRAILLLEMSKGMNIKYPECTGLSMNDIHRIFG